LVVIPDLDAGALALVESLLQAANVQDTCLPGDNDMTPPRVLVRSSDLFDVKESLADVRIRTPKGNLAPIPW
jgi:hypothetical protein